MFVLNEFCSLSQRLFFFSKRSPEFNRELLYFFVHFAVVVARNDPTNCPLLIVNYQLLIVN